MANPIMPDPDMPTGSSLSGSSANTPGTDEYARIIVQSRNAKMQKWRSQQRPSSPVGSAGSRTPMQRVGSGVGAESDDLDIYSRHPSARNMPTLGRRETTLGLRGRMHSAAGSVQQSRDDVLSTAPASEQDIADSDLGGLSPTIGFDNDGGREIEWVDWLDEYRKMKEAKLQSEREEAENRRRAERKEPADENRSNVGAQPEEAGSSSETAGAELAEPEGKDIANRRQSGLPRPTHKTTAETRRSLSLMPGQRFDMALGHGHPSPPHKRTSLFPEKQRTISLSPITSRIASSGSQSTSSMSSSVTRKKRNLGGKIEAWWSAVKSGFGGQSGDEYKDTMSTRTASSQHSPRTYLDVGPATPSIFGAASFGNAHARVHTNNSPQQAESVRSLRPATSAQELKDQRRSKQGGGGGAEPDRSSRDVTTTADAPVEKERSSRSSSRGSEETTGRDPSKRRFPPLSLNLEKGLSAFDSSAFDGVTDDRSPSTGRSHAMSQTAEPSMSAMSSQFLRSPSMQTESDRPSPSVPTRPATPGSPADGRALSRPWRPTPTPTHTSSVPGSDQEGDGGGSGSGKAPSRDGRGLSSKDITVNSIRQHIRHRLASSKESCDKELKKIVLAINAFVEETLQYREDEGEDGEDEIEEVALDDGASDVPLPPKLGLDGVEQSFTPGIRSAPISRGGSISRVERRGSVYRASDQGSDRDDDFDPDETPQREYESVLSGG